MKKTLVIGINLHGEIPLDKDNNPETRKLDNSFIITMDAVTPGVPFISTLENYNNLSEITKKLVKSNDWLNYPMQSDRQFAETYKNKMIDFVTTIKTKFIKETTENVKGIEHEYSKKRKHNEPFGHEQDFIHNKDSLFTISTFDNGDSIANKLFLKFTQEELDQLNIDEIADKDFNKIIIYNLDNIDVFELLGPEYTSITLFNLIDLLTGMGAEKIIFIDLSCSVFISDSKITKRTIRNVRRQIIKSKKKSGKKQNTTKNGGKKNSGKTRTVKRSV